jgi:hypothetical protein
MGEVVQMPIRRRPRVDRAAESGGTAQILLWTGAWRERLVEPAPRRRQSDRPKKPGPAAGRKKRA